MRRDFLSLLFLTHWSSWMIAKKRVTVPETLVGNFDVGGGAVAHVVQAVLHHEVHPLNQVLVVNLPN
jgi:hypothetical protein